MASLNEIRTGFLEFFKRHGHELVPSSPLVPRNDPTLLFTNAGMVQFKNVFTGAETRAYKRAASVQKCVRAGGKHNDLDNVGYTARHHTFFEMLGNFSFGDYFQEEAIVFAWEYVSKVLAFPKERLWVTVHPSDATARALWGKIAGFADERIVSHPDNLWAMGPVGPCGYNSEIFFDQGDKISGGPPGSPEEDGDRFLEFWNLVFMQFEQVNETTRIPLPKPSVDTGLGLERLAAILQGVFSNYDTDLFQALIRASVEASGVRADGAQRASHRVIADHLRASSFLIADGVMPSHEGRGYVLRRIMRRAMRHAHLLGTEEPLLWRLVPALIREMGAPYPELVRAEALITETQKLEETRFRQTLGRGLKLLDEAAAGLSSGATLSGETVFKLYDTYGFPPDLTEDALRARGIGIDTTGFESAMAKQRAEARAAWAGSGEAVTERVWLDLIARFGATEFLGYETLEAEGSILALLVSGKDVTEIAEGTEAEIITNQTPFYAESGGQVGDTGRIFTRTGAEFAVTSTQKRAAGLHVHVGKVTKGRFKPGEIVEMQVNAEARAQTRANHSATHLLHAALRAVLGPHVTQRGSLVAPDRLRFDFSHGKAMSDAEITAVEEIVNAQIRRNGEVSTRLMTPDQAISSGAMALFGEKYGEEVRVLSMGAANSNGGDAKPFSVELCGGTHVARTGDIQLLKIVNESAVAGGVRRIEALTGEAARLWLAGRERLLREAAGALRASPEEVPARLSNLLEERKRLERELSEAKKALALGGGSAANSDAPKDIAGLKTVLRVLNGVAAKDLKALADDAKAKLGSGIVAFITVADGKASLVVAVTPDLTARVSAVDLVRTGAEALGGKGGGGRPDMAQAGGPDGARAEAALTAIAEKLSALQSAA